MTIAACHQTPSDAQAFWRVLDLALDNIREGAAGRDRHTPPQFPGDAFSELRAVGALGFNAHPGVRRPPADLELSLVRRVAAADGSVGRIYDGHLNAVERLAVHAPAELRNRELQAVCDGRLLAGVWGGEPGALDGPSAALVSGADGEVIRGVKTFCSGAGGLDRAAVLVHSDGELRTLVWVDLHHSGVEIDRSWYRGAGLVASESHRVVFHDVPVLAKLGPPGAITAQPWFARDALRTAATWAGMADTAVGGALRSLAARPGSELEALAAGRILTAQRGIDAWLSTAAAAIDGEDPGLPVLAVQARVGIADCCRTLLDEASRACGSTPFARGLDLDRGRRDLELFLLQHRLDPLLVRVGAGALENLR